MPEWKGAYEFFRHFGSVVNIMNKKDMLEALNDPNERGDKDQL